jgi:hypothetical protein
MEIGRPTVMTPEALLILEDAFSVGASDKEAIFLANISSSTFYAYCKDHPEFSERKEALKDMPKYRARKNIVGKINEGDVPVSQWYAERKAKEEFSNRTDLNVSGEMISKVIKLDIE